MTFWSRLGQKNVFYFSLKTHSKIRVSFHIFIIFRGLFRVSFEWNYYMTINMRVISKWCTLNDVRLTGISQCSETLSKSQKNSQVSQKNSQLSQKYSQLSQKNSQLSQKNSQLSQKNSQLSQKNSQLSQKNSQTESFRTLWNSC